MWVQRESSSSLTPPEVLSMNCTTEQPCLEVSRPASSICTSVGYRLLADRSVFCFSVHFLVLAFMCFHNITAHIEYSGFSPNLMPGTLCSLSCLFLSFVLVLPHFPASPQPQDAKNHLECLSFHTFLHNIPILEMKERTSL